MSFLTELRRRNVIRVAIAYLVIAWLVLQVADLMIDNIGAPDWLFQAILMVLGIGFLFALVFSWIFELTSEGLMRDADAERNPALARLREGLTPAQVDQLKTRYSKNNPEEGASISYSTSRIWLVQAGELDHVIEADLAGLERPGEATMHEWAWTEPYAALRRFERHPEFLQKSGLVEYWDATSWPDWCQRDADGVIRCK